MLILCDKMSNMAILLIFCNRHCQKAAIFKNIKTLKLKNVRLYGMVLWYIFQQNLKKMATPSTFFTKYSRFQCFCIVRKKSY